MGGFYGPVPDQIVAPKPQPFDHSALSQQGLLSQLGQQSNNQFGRPQIDLSIGNQQSPYQFGRQQIDLSQLGQTPQNQFGRQQVDLQQLKRGRNNG